ncbi:hypothetical protein ACIBJI_24490 [Nocardia sp. NPDC050408]|uniref:hypothetical protein n=1 Tax=Nocardia sp. NPDC050408 TaxID=3364319 RepID=UPI0037B8C0C2
MTSMTASSWDHITALLADPQLIHTEIDKRLQTAKHPIPLSLNTNGSKPHWPKRVRASPG